MTREDRIALLHDKGINVPGMDGLSRPAGMSGIEEVESPEEFIGALQRPADTRLVLSGDVFAKSGVTRVESILVKQLKSGGGTTRNLETIGLTSTDQIYPARYRNVDTGTSFSKSVAGISTDNVITIGTFKSRSDPSNEDNRIRYSIAHRSGESGLGSGLSFVEAPNADAVASGAFSYADTPNLMVARLGNAILQGPGIFDNSDLPSSFDSTKRLVWFETNWDSMKKDLGVDMRSGNGDPSNEWNDGDGLLVIFMNGKTLDYVTPSRWGDDVFASTVINDKKSPVPWLGGFMRVASDKRLDFETYGDTPTTSFGIKSVIAGPYQDVVSMCSSLSRSVWSVFVTEHSPSATIQYYSGHNVPADMRTGDVRLIVFASAAIDPDDAGAGKALCVPIAHGTPEAGTSVPFIDTFVDSVPCNENGVVIADKTVSTNVRIVEQRFAGVPQVSYVPESNIADRNSVSVDCFDANGEKTSVTPEYEYEYELVSTKPDNWSSEYDRYYYKTNQSSEYVQNSTQTWYSGRTYYKRVVTENEKNKFSWTFRKGMAIPRDHVDIRLINGFGEAYDGFCVMRIKFPRIATTSEVLNQSVGVSVKTMSSSIVSTISNENYQSFVVRADVQWSGRREVTVSKSGSTLFDYVRFLPKFPKCVELADLTLDDLKEEDSLSSAKVMSFRDLVHDLTAYGGVEHLHFGAMSLSDFLDVAEYSRQQSSSSSSAGDVSASYLNGVAEGTRLEFFAPRGAIEVHSVDASDETPWGFSEARAEALSQASMNDVEGRFLSGGTFEYDPSNEYVNPCGWSEQDLSNDFSNEVGTDVVVVPYTGYGNNADPSVFKAKNAGTYHIRLAVRDTRETKWPDGSDATKVFTWKIRPRSISMPENATYTYDGYTGHQATDRFQDYLGDQSKVPLDLRKQIENKEILVELTLDGESEDLAMDAGEYQVLFKNKNENYTFGTGSSTSVTRALTIERKIVAAPNFSSPWNTESVSREYDLNGGADVLQDMFDHLDSQAVQADWGTELLDRINDQSNEFRGGNVKVFTNGTGNYKWFSVTCYPENWRVDEDADNPLDGDLGVAFTVVDSYNIEFRGGETSYTKTITFTKAVLPEFEGFTVEYDPSNESMLAEVMNHSASSLGVQPGNRKYYGYWSPPDESNPSYMMRNSEGRVLAYADIMKRTANGDIINGFADAQVFNSFPSDVSMTARLRFSVANSGITCFMSNGTEYDNFEEDVVLSRHVMTLNTGKAVEITVDDTQSSTGYIVDAVLGNPNVFDSNDIHGRSVDWYRNNVVEATVQKYNDSNNTWEATNDFGAGLISKSVLVKTISGGAYGGLYCFGGGNSNIVTQKTVPLVMYLINLPFPDEYTFPESGYTSSTRVTLPYIKIQFTSSEGGNTHDYIDDVIPELRNWITGHSIEGHEHWDRMLAYVNQNKLSITAAVNGVWTRSEGTTNYTFTNGVPTTEYQKMQVACVYRVKISLAEVANSGAPLLWTVSSLKKSWYSVGGDEREIIVDLRPNQ